MTDLAKRGARALAPKSARTALARWRGAIDQRVLTARAPKAEGRKGPSEAATVVGFLGGALGLGRAAHLLLAELEAAKFPARGVNLDLGAAQGALDAWGGADDALILHCNPDVLGHALARLTPASLSGRRRIGYWAWELDRAPETWRLAAERLDEIWAPSRFAAAALEASLGRAVRVVPHPVALETPAMTERGAARARLGIAEGAFLAVSSFSFASSMARKNPLAAIAAFKAAFGGDPGAVLVIRCLGGDYHPRMRQALQRAAAAGSVRVIDAQPGEGMATVEDLYAACDVYLSLHRSEGFGLNLAEAMLRGRPVVATAWSGNLDFMDALTSLLVPAERIEVRDPQGVYGVRGARWAEPNVDVAAAHLRALRDDPGLGPAIGARAAAAVKLKLGGGAAVAALRCR